MIAGGHDPGPETTSGEYTSLNRGYGRWPDITSGDALSVGHFGKIGHDPWPKNKLGGIKLSF